MVRLLGIRLHFPLRLLSPSLLPSLIDGIGISLPRLSPLVPRASGRYASAFVSEDGRASSFRA